MCVSFKDFPIILLKLYNGNQSAFSPMPFVKFLDFNSQKNQQNHGKNAKNAQKSYKNVVFGVLFNKNYSFIIFFYCNDQRAW